MQMVCTFVCCFSVLKRLQKLPKNIFAQQRQPKFQIVEVTNPTNGIWSAQI